MWFPQRFYETTLLEDGGWSGGVISAPKEPGSIGWIPAGERAQELGLTILAPDALTYIESVIADASVTSSVADQWFNAPIVILESSPPVGQALKGLIATGSATMGGHELVQLGASPAVLVAYSTAWALAWVVAPAVAGAREAIHQEARERTAAWLRRHR
jgi:hypothetical protein